ncbi:MAG: STAS domain-containing protein [Nitrococcus mobilis]|nr:STAS domain-containing protein [Nitrococcus mobilis]
MSAAHLATKEEGGRLALLGELTFETVPGLSKNLDSMVRQEPRLRVDLAELERVDSAGLAFLIEWTRLARAFGHVLEFVNIPQQLLTIARLSGVERILPLLPADSETDADGRRITGERP